MSTWRMKQPDITQDGLGGLELTLTLVRSGEETPQDVRMEIRRALPEGAGEEILSVISTEGMSAPQTPPPDGWERVEGGGEDFGFDFGFAEEDVDDPDVEIAKAQIRQRLIEMDHELKTRAGDLARSATSAFYLAGTPEQPSDWTDTWEEQYRRILAVLDEPVPTVTVEPVATG